MQENKLEDLFPAIPLKDVEPKMVYVTSAGCDSEYHKMFELYKKYLESLEHKPNVKQIKVTHDFWKQMLNECHLLCLNQA